VLATLLYSGITNPSIKWDATRLSVPVATPFGCAMSQAGA
jgi:hypothetical protein